MSSPRPSRPRPAALVRAEHGGRPVNLTSPQRTILNEALRRGEDLCETVEAQVMSYGRWLLGAIFNDNATAALDEKTKNPLWLELVRRAGGPTLHVSRHMLYVVLSLAANDKRIPDQSWQRLDAGRKELLLPLGSDDRLREAAQHVSKFNLTQAKTKEYVTELMDDTGQRRQIRLTAPQIAARVRKLREGLGKPSVLRRIGELRNTMPHAEREQVALEIEKLRGVLEEVSRAIRGRRSAG